MSAEQAAAERGVTDVLGALTAAGLKVSLTPEQVRSIAALVVGLVGVVSGAAVKHAALAGVDAAAAVTTVEQANAVLKAAAAAQEKP